MFGWIASLAISIFEWAIDPNDVNMLFNNAGVYESWKFVRDFFNLFFILVLLYIAFTVVFQIQKDFKKALLSLVLAALFVNFSFPISRVLIDVTNVPMYFFVNQMGGRNAAEGTGVFGGALTASHIKGILVPGGETEGTVDTDSVGVARLLMAIVFIFLFSITLLVLSIMFVIRLVALVVLVMFSSVGFVASIIPGMEQYSKMWWDNFWKYAIFGPAAMLMLLIATRFFAAIGDESGQLMMSMQKISGNIATPGETTFFASMALFTIPIIMLWMAMALAQKMSIAGASSVVGMGQKFSKWAGKAALAPVPWAGRKIESKLANTKYGKYLAPHAVMQAFKQRSEEQKHRDEQPIKLAASTMQDQLNGAISRVKNTIVPANYLPGNWGKLWANTDHTDHAFAEAESQAAVHKKEMTAVTSDGPHIIHEMEAGLASKETPKVVGALQILAKNNDLNDMLTTVGKDAKYGLAKDAAGEVVVSSENMMQLLPQILKEAGVDNAELLAKQMMVISENATASGNFAFGGMTKFDETMNHGRGGFRLSKPAEQAGWAAGKVKNLESQKRQTTIHPDSMFTRTENGGFGDINGDVAKALISTFTGADVAQVDRSRDDLKEAIHKAYTNMSPKFMEQYNNNDIFKQYVTEVVKMKRGFKKGDKVPDEWVQKNGPGTQYVQPTASSAAAPASTAGGSMSSGAHGSPIAMPTPSAGGGPRRNP
ncbi:MAG: hypothetical protein WAV46_01835 [Candidatus Moraniibacteriota bacterium]